MVVGKTTRGLDLRRERKKLSEARAARDEGRGAELLVDRK